MTRTSCCASGPRPPTPCGRATCWSCSGRTCSSSRWPSGCGHASAPTGTAWATGFVAGLAYLGVGAAGASILAAVWPALIQEFTSMPSDRGAIRVAFVTATRIAEDGLQGAVQNAAGAVWWTTIGLRLRHLKHRKLAVLTLVLGAASAVNALGSLLSADALTLPGLTLTVLLAPVWSVSVGLTVVRGRLAGRSSLRSGPEPSPLAAG